MSEAPLKATLKAGTGYDAPWLTVDGSTPEELEQRLKAITAGGVIQATVEAANALKAANNAGPLLGGNAEPQQSAPQQGWGQAVTNGPPPQQYQQRPQQQNNGGGGYGASQHPEGEACHCGKVLEFGKTRTNKGQWKCPDYRWNSGNPNDHRLEWAN